jgi:large subunit ribosomal protein L24
MSSKVHVVRGDTVYVLSGKDSGKKGKVLKVFTDDSRVVVEGVNMVKKHKKPSQTKPGGIINQEAPIHSSNVMLICDKCKTPTKIGKLVYESGEKARVCKKCNDVIGVIKKPRDK